MAYEIASAEAEAVIFDWNGTLSDMDVLIQQDIYVGKNVFDIDLTREEVIDAFRCPVETLYPKLFGRGGTDMTWRDMRRVFLDHDNMFPRRLLPGVLSTVSLLREKGLMTGIVTSGARENVLQYIIQSGLPDKAMDFIHTSREVEAAAAQGLPALHTAVGECAVRGIKPSEIVFVGDAAVTVTDAEAVGVRPVVVASGVVSRQGLLDRGVPSNIIIDAIDQLPDYLHINK